MAKRVVTALVMAKRVIMAVLAPVMALNGHYGCPGTGYGTKRVIMAVLTALMTKRVIMAVLTALTTKWVIMALMAVMAVVDPVARMVTWRRSHHCRLRRQWGF